MRKTTIAALLATAIGVTQPAMAGGIPVIDVSSLTQQILQVQHMLNQIEQLKSQLETANKELDSMSGVRGLGNVIDSAYDTAVNVDPNQVLNDAGIRGANEHGLTGDVADLYDSGNQNTATWLGQSQKSLEQAQERFSELTGLVAEVNNSPDQKDVLDLQARIGAEQVMLQNEMAKLSMLRSQAEANQAMHNQRVQQMTVESSGELREVAW
ncbi:MULTISPECIES: type IV secretion system protein [Gammaproteobacteria]|jgi:type IV secretion system protein VirB5|uniref:Type IV secretion protein n=1 Tax=Vibrio alginolyticus TaxID=663 RepID=A0A2K9UZ83_VIBAL|nr:MULTISPECIES: type IV secretion system protein [Gammaproteobacteria]AUV50327.1 type IV secretion protein [Vibrio alginolyticus]AWX05518.1 type IV secretion protein [Enterobacter hormaechei]MDW3058878.1 type IV secretion system protein [Vibrio sp. 1978]RAM40189.1 type IV secretion protein [Enterobacter hormaechei]RCR64748.1 type IV secretion protein [Vibrio harveyi]